MQHSILKQFLNSAFRYSLQLIVFVVYIQSVVGQENSDVLESHALSLAAYNARGDFGLDLDTDIVFLPLRYEYDRGNWGFQLFVPYLEVDGPGAVLVNLGGVNRPIAGTQARKESGLGDVLGSVIYRIDPIGPNAPFIDLRLDVKIPTADETKGLGTGEADYNLQVDLSRYLGDWVVFATLGYSFRGESELFPDLNSGAYAQLGAALPLRDSMSIGVIYDYRQAASSFTSDIQEIGPYLNWQLDEHWSVTGLIMSGMTSASVDMSVLGQLRYSW